MTVNNKFDLHVHTAEVSPCSNIGAVQAVEMYHSIGYRGIVITDHFYEGFFNYRSGLSRLEAVEEFFEGYRKALAAGREVGLLVFPGMEIKFKDDPNDYLVYGASEDFIREYPDLSRRNLAWLHEIGEKEGLLIYQAHPFRDGLTRAEPELLTGVEVMNGNPRHLSRNELAYQFAEENGLKMISGSDLHETEDLGRGGISTPERITSLEEFLAVLREERYELLP